jgi:hypothetical protein
MTKRRIDEHAVRIPQMSGLLPCLYIPVAARDVRAIAAFVGRIIGDFSPRGHPERALLIESYEPEPPDNRLAIWAHPRAAVLHSPRQLWVHVDYSGYRRAYARAFPEIDINPYVIDHVMNRRVARLKGFAFLRVVPTSREANSSHGGLSEGWAVAHHSSGEMREKNRVSQATVQYADLADVVKMLDMEGGGSFMSVVNEAQKLVDLSD